MEELIDKDIDIKIESLLDTNELNRLQRAAKNKDKNEIKKWAENYNKLVSEKYYEIYKREYTRWLMETAEDFDIALCNALHFGNTKFTKRRIQNFMKDFRQNIRGFYKGEFNREDYKKQLINDGVDLWEVDND